jgi:hypothetical protein
VAFYLQRHVCNNDGCARPTDRSFVAVYTSDDPAGHTAALLHFYCPRHLGMVSDPSYGESLHDVSSTLEVTLYRTIEPG